MTLFDTSSFSLSRIAKNEHYSAASWLKRARRAHAELRRQAELVAAAPDDPEAAEIQAALQITALAVADAAEAVRRARERVEEAEDEMA